MHFICTVSLGTLKGAFKIKCIIIIIIIIINTIVVFGCFFYLVAAPAVGEGGSLFLDADHLPHVLVGRVPGHQVVVGQLVVLHDAWGGVEGRAHTHTRLKIRIGLH